MTKFNYEKVIPALIIIGVIIFLCLHTLTGNNNVPVLMYHHISPQVKDANTVVSPQKLRRDFTELKKLGFTPVHFKDILDSESGKTQLPAKPVVITFDDGYLSSYQYLFPLLKEFNFKANINIVVSQVGKTPGSLAHFNWEQAREMADSGLVELGVHTYDLHGAMGVRPQEHEPLRQYAQRFQYDTSKATVDFAKNLDFQPYIYSYPYGKYNSITEEILQINGYEVTLSIFPRWHKGLTNVKRINVPEHVSIKELLKGRGNH